MIIQQPSEITVAQLFEAYYDCRRHKRTTRSALDFEVALEDNLMRLLAELRAGTWWPAPATVFAITRPKPREVWAAQFRDRIVHHLVYRAINPLFEPAFIIDSCACIKGRGTLYAAGRLERHLRSATEGWSKPAYVLKADIANFFGSIRHDVLFGMLARRISDPTMLELCRRLVFQDVRQGAIVQDFAGTLARVPPHKSLFQTAPGVGLPIGNLSSQFFANVYLDPIDQMVKRRLGLRYVRYVDDMVMVHQDPKVLLAAADAIRAHLAGLGMTLAEHKTAVAPIEKGSDFVGHVIRPHRRSARTKTHRVALARLATMPKADLPESATSYLGLFRHSGSRAQIAAIGRVAIRRGCRVDRDLTKVTFKPRRATMTNRNPMLAKVHIAKKELGLDDETYREVLSRVTGKTSSAGLKDHQLDAVLAEFKRLGWKGKQVNIHGRSDTGHARKARALWLSLHHLGLVDDPSETALRAWVKRQHQVDDLRFVRASEAAPVIEGLKAWAARAGVAWGKYDQQPSDVHGRRAVLAAQWRILVKAQATPAMDLGRHAMSVVGQPSPAFCTAAELDRLIVDLGGHVRALKATDKDGEDHG